MSDQTTAGPPESWWRMTTARKLEIKALIGHAYGRPAEWSGDACESLPTLLDEAWDEAVNAGDRRLSLQCQLAYESLSGTGEVK